jgi:diaminopimelate epimerase
LGKVGNDVTVKMPGGELKINIDNEYNLRLTGEVRQIAEGILSDELIEDFH